MPLFPSAIQMPQFAATPPTPPAATDSIYFKTDNMPYWLGPDGIERPFITTPPSLHLNPTFDSVATNRPTNWDSTTWVINSATISSDNSAGNFVGGYSAKFTNATASASWGWLTEGVTHAVNDQQQVTFGIWAKTTLGTATVPQLHLMHMTNTTDAGTGFGQAGVVQTDRLITISTAWRYYEVTYNIPSGHLFGRFCVGFTQGGTPAAGSTWVDESVSSARTVSVSTNGRLYSAASASAANIPTGNFTTITGGWQADSDWEMQFASYSSGVWTFTSPGMYLLQGEASLTSVSGGSRRAIRLAKNGIEIARQDTSIGTNTPTTMNVIRISRMAVGDTLTLDVFHNTGANLALQATPGHAIQFLKVND